MFESGKLLIDDLKRIFQFDIPPWVPECLIDPARRIYARELNAGRTFDVVLLQRLLTDERMKTVWRQLSKRKHTDHTSTPEFLYPVRKPEDSAPGSPQDLMDRAIQELFICTFNEGRWHKLLEASDRYDEKAGKLRQDAERLPKLPTRQVEQIRARLLKAAAAYDELNKTLAQADARMFCVKVSDLLNERFGARMYGVVAILALVALERPTTTPQVREWCSPRRRARPRPKYGD